MKRIAIIGHRYFINKLSQFFKDKNYDIITISNIGKWNRNPFSFLNELKNVNLVYFFNGLGFKKIKNVIFLKFILRKKVIVHFVGSDALKLITRNFIEKMKWKIALKSANKVFGISQNIVNELSSFVNIKYLPISFEEFNHKFQPYPLKFTAITYLPTVKDLNFYGANFIYELIENNPDIDFIILGDNNNNLHFDNVEFIPIDMNIDLSDLYERSSVLLRLTEHDGLSNMVLESLARGRHVIWTSKFPFTQLTMRDLNSIQNELDRVKTKGDNREAMKWVQNNYNQSKLMENLEKTFY